MTISLLALLASQAVAMEDQFAGEAGQQAGFFIGYDWANHENPLTEKALLVAGMQAQEKELPFCNPGSQKKEDDARELPFTCNKGGEHSINWDLLFQGTGYLSYSSLEGGGKVLGGKGSVVVAPVVRLDENKSIILLYTGSYRKTKQIFVQDEGPKLFSEDIIQNVIPTFRYVWSPKLIVSPTIVFTEVKTKETSDDTWDNGLYNYRDIGVGVKVERQLKAVPTVKKVVSLGVQRFRREYPNFISLAAIAGIGLFEEREKDFDGTLVSLKHEKKRKSGWSNTFTASFLDKRYVDKLVENRTGERDPVKQYDYNLNLSDQILYQTKTGWAYSVEGAFGYTGSNQNMTEGSFPLTVFHPDYYSAYSVSVRPGVRFTQLKALGRTLIYCAEFGVTRNSYIARRARAQSGVFLAETQVDWANNLNLKMVYNLNKHWNVGLVFDYTKVTSNMEYERLYRYNYQVINLSAGFSYRY